MRIKHKTIADIIMLLIIDQVVVFRYFNVYETVNKVIAVAIIILAFLSFVKNRRIEKKIHFSWSILFLIGLIVLNGYFYGVGGAYLSNILMLLYPFVFMLYITWYINKYEQCAFDTLVKWKYIINIYFIVNILVLFVQIKGVEFMWGYTTTENQSAVDKMSGLFGYSMTATLCFFSVFVVAYNMVISRTIGSKTRRKVFITYNVCLTLLMAYISTQNDNVMYFFFLPLTIIILLLSIYKLSTLSGILKFFIIILSFTIIGSLLLLIIPDLFSKLYDSIFFKFTGAIEHMYDGASVTHGSMERLALLVYGLQHANGWHMGEGLSYSGIYTPNTYGFVHFGNANIGAIVCLAGIWFFVILVYIYSSRTMTMMPATMKNRWGIYVLIYLLWMLAAMFSLPFSDPSIGICLDFIMVVLALNQNIGEQINHG